MRFRMKTPHLRYYARIATAPLIFGLIVPLVFLDICIEFYHRIAFPIYGLPLIERRKYIALDRHRLPYLDFWEKIFCDYCGYANGFLAYACAIAGATEGYFCSIKHKSKQLYVEPHQKNFLPYGDEKTLKKKYPAYRDKRKGK